jgi:hypothetical protein
VPKDKTICLYRNGKVKWISNFDLLINRNTPRGEPADYYERKPFNGRRMLANEELLGRIVNGEFEIDDAKMTDERLSAIKGLDIPISSKLFYNGAVYTTIDSPFKTLKQALRDNERKQRA